jgi:hypothetical protein
MTSCLTAKLICQLLREIENQLFIICARCCTGWFMLIFVIVLLGMGNHFSHGILKLKALRKLVTNFLIGLSHRVGIQIIFLT